MTRGVGFVAAAALAFALLSACAQTSVKPGADGKLPTGVTPLHYSLALTIDPRQARFSGEARIRLKFDKQTRSFWIHGRDLRVNAASLNPASGSASGSASGPASGPASGSASGPASGSASGSASGPAIAATYAENGEGLAEITLAHAAPAGEATLNLTYDAPFNENAAGLYHSTSGGDKYAVTQFEAVDARRAFPGFDQPNFKTPYDITITARAGDTVIANTGEVSAQAAGDDLVTHTFRETLPLPTYLVAFAVGPFDVIDGPVLPVTPLRDHVVPLRGVAVKGKGAQTRYALSVTADIIKYYEDYFDTPYPYDKLDFIAAPEFSAGAMENAGAIVYAEPAILIEPNGPIAQQTGVITTHAHEIAHQWFGDLVTPAWWDDIWLNEAFATWISYKAAKAIFPHGGFDRETQLEAIDAMDDDSLSSARRIREPIVRESDIEDAFDNITYDKGGGVLAMAESYLGEDAFRDGVRTHMHRFPMGVATSQDFFESLGEGSRHPEIVPALASFTDRSHVPLLDVRVDCPSDGSAARARLTQRTYEPIGVSLERRSWSIPVCVSSYGLTGGGDKSCAILSQTDGVVPLRGACPAFVSPNAGGAGYYRFALDERGWTALVAGFSRLPPGEQIAVLDSIHASFVAGQASGSLLLRALEAGAGASDLEVRRKAVGVAKGLAKIPSTAPAQAAYAAWVRAAFTRSVAETAMSSRATPAERRTALSVTELLALYGHDPAVRARLLSGARGAIGMAHTTPASPDVRAVALIVGVEDDGPAFFARLLEKAKTSTDAQFQAEALSALSHTPNTADLEAFATAIVSDPFTGSQMRRALFATQRSPQTASVGLAILRDHFDAIVARMPGGLAGQSAPRFANIVCTTDERKTLTDLFAANAAKAPGYERSLAQAVEEIDRCVALRAAKGGELGSAMNATH